MPRPWWETIFDERYPELFGPLERDPEEEVARIVGLLSLPSGASVVDLGCGRGRHAIPLSRRGYRVTGVGLSDQMLGRGRGHPWGGGGRTCGSSPAAAPSTPVSPSSPRSDFSTMKRMNW